MRESLILDDASFCAPQYLSGALHSRFGSAKWRTIQRKVTHHTAQSETAYKAKLENSQQKINRKFGTFGFFAYLWTHGDRSAELLHYFLSLVAFSGSEAMFSYTSTRFSSRGRVISNKARLFFNKYNTGISFVRAVLCYEILYSRKLTIYEITK